MSKKHKKKARAAKNKPHTVKEAKMRKRHRENLKAKRASTKVQQSSKSDLPDIGTTQSKIIKDGEASRGKTSDLNSTSGSTHQNHHGS